MRFYLSFLVLSCLFCIDLSAQCQNGILEDEVWGTIRNNHRANTAFTYGMPSYQNLEDNFYFDGQEDSLFYLGFGKAIWAAARDGADNLKVSANSFPSLTKNDFLPGPLNRQTGQPIDTLCGVFNRVWIVNQFDIFDLQVKFQDGTLALDDIPDDILEWPATGNPYMEDLAPDFDLAPFMDVSGDGIYDPLEGDLPIVLEENPDFIPAEFSFVVYNDMTTHTNSGGEPIGLEFHQTNYVVNCAEDTEADHTVFTRLRYHYLGQEPLSELKISLFEDFDLACNENDYAGCNLDLNCTFNYNKGGETFVGACHDFDVPNDNGAIRSTIFLNHDMKSFKPFYLLGIGDTLVPGIDPTGPMEHYFYMSGLWRDGMPQTVGGNAYDPNSTETTLFAFPDRPDQADGWSMETADIATPRDVRTLTTLIDEGQVMPGTTGTIDFADYFLYDPQLKKLDIFGVWPDKINDLKSEFAGMQDGTFGCSSGLEQCVADCVWPGDANRDRGVTAKDYLFVGVLAGQTITDGIPRGISTTEWFGFNADNWGTEFLGINAKNADVNGNGIINELDVQAIDDNFGLTRDGFVEQQELLVPTPGENRLQISLEENLVDLSTAALFDRIIGLEVFLTGPNSEVLSPGVHGVSFDMRYDTNMITPFAFLMQDGNDIFQHNFAFIRDRERTGSNELVGDNRIQYAFTNYNSIDITQRGQLVDQDMLVRETATTSNPDGRDTVVIKFYNVCAFNSSGQLLSMDAQYDTLILTNLAIDPDLTSDVEEVPELDVTLFPNPVTNVVNVQMDETLEGVVKIYDIHGRVQYEEAISGQQFSVPTRAYPVGVYFLQVQSASGATVTRSFVKEAFR